MRFDIGLHIVKSTQPNNGSRNIITNFRTYKYKYETDRVRINTGQCFEMAVSLSKMSKEHLKLKTQKYTALGRRIKKKRRKAGRWTATMQRAALS